MCKHAQHLGDQVRIFQEVTYPHLTIVLTHALQCNVANRSYFPEIKVTKEIIQAIHSEFHSLITYEEKLVFPEYFSYLIKRIMQNITPTLPIYYSSQKVRNINYIVSWVL